MKVVKETIEKEITPETKNLLFQKEFLEYKIPETIEGIKVYDNYLETIKDSKDTLDKVVYYETKTKAQNLAIQLRYYYHNHKTVIETLKGSGVEVDDVKDEEINKAVLDLFETEIYGSVGFETSEKELPKIITDLEKYVVLLKNKLSFLEENSNPVNDIEAYNTKRHIICLEKRISERKKYYIEQFLPIYEVDMKQCRRLLDKYIKRGKVFAEAKLDPALGFIISNHEKNKGSDKDLWAFWKALKTRVDSCIEQLQKQRDTLPTQFLNYLTPIK